MYKERGKIKMYQSHPEIAYIDKFTRRVIHDTDDCVRGKEDMPNGLARVLKTVLVENSHKAIWEQHINLLQWAENHQVSIGVVAIEFSQMADSHLLYAKGVPMVRQYKASEDWDLAEMDQDDYLLTEITLTDPDEGKVTFESIFGDDDMISIVAVLTEVPSWLANGELTTK